MNTTIAALLDSHRADIVAACETYGVAHLDLFGAAASADSKSGAGTLDMAVRFLPAVSHRATDNYAGLHGKLAEVLGHRIDLVSYNGVSNRYLLSEIERNRERIYPLN
jgi:predicted nucleotidyltransferase